MCFSITRKFLYEQSHFYGIEFQSDPEWCNLFLSHYHHVPATDLKKELRITATLTESRSFVFVSQSYIHMTVIVQFVTVRTVRICADKKFALFATCTKLILLGSKTIHKISSCV